MSTTQVVDTHRLMYRNARLRAISLSDKTTPIQFLNITDEAEIVEIGNIVYTDACGYVFYGANHRRVSCLAVAESAIIQVDLHDNDNWNDIEWIVRVEDDSQFVRVDDVGKVIDKDGNLLWDPLRGNWYPFPDFMRRDEFNEAEWAEGEMTVTDTTPKQLSVDKWTHTIIVRPGHAAEYEISIANGRVGQCITIVNASDASVTITETHSGGSSSQTIGPNGAIIAVRSLGVNQWVLRAFDEGEHVAGTRRLYKQLLNGNNSNTWINHADIKENANNVIAGDDSGTKFVPPRSIAFTNNNRILNVMNGDGIVTPVTNTMMRYEGSGDWVLEQNSSSPISPAHIVSIDVGSDIYPDDHPFGHHIGENKLFIRIPTVPGERIHVVLRVATTINVGTTRTIKMFVNECLVYNQSTNQIVNTDCLVSGWLERGQDDDGAWFFWAEDTSYAKV